MSLGILKSSRMLATIVAAMVVLTIAGSTVPAQAQTYTVLYNFGTNTNDPLQPHGPDAIAQGRDGNLYTTSANGGTGNNGTVFKVTPSGTLSVVSNLANPGNSPFSGVTLGTDGNFYGTTDLNGEGPGTVFKVTPAGLETGLHIFGNTGDGACPWAAPIEGTDGNYYGTTTTVCGFGSRGTVYKVTSAGVLTTLHTFTGPDGNNITDQLVQGTDGNFYGTSYDGGANNDGVIFKMTPSGTVTVLHNFTGADGSAVYRGLIQASDGNFYGDTNAGGSSNAGVIFKITPSGTYTVLHNLNGTTDGNGLGSSLTQATDGKLYGVADAGGSSNLGTIFSITTSGTFTVLVNFDGTNGSTPNSPLKQNTNGTLYGDTYQGGNLSLCGSAGCGVFYSLNIGAKPFVTLSSTSGKVGSKVNIFGQGFSASSVVKFNGVQATTVTVSGTTYLTATVPAGATDGFVTVTTGSTTLTSTQKYTVHNSWSSGAAVPVAVAAPATGLISGKIYVVGGFATSGGAPVSNNQIYNPSTNKWTTGTAIPTPVWAPASAVVSGILYVIGGYEGTNQTLSNLVQAYNPTTNTWTAKSAMPTARGSIAAAVNSNAIYVIGGNGSTLRLNTVEKYVPSTDTWTEEAPLLVGKSEPSAGFVGSTIVAADGYTTSGDTGDDEGYTVSTNTWSSLTADPTPRNASCYGVLSSQLYVAGGFTFGGATTTMNESYSVSSKKWTTQAAMPTAAVWQGSAVDNGVLYCIGGQASFEGAVINNVRIYQP